MPWRKLKISDQRLDRLMQWTYFVVAPILLGVVLTMLFYSITTNIRLKNYASQIQQLSLDNKQLSKENKQLNAQTQGVVTDNKTYIKCLASIFAQYTNDQQPIKIEDLDKCQVSKISSQANSSASVQALSGSSGSSVSSSKNTSSAPQSQPNSSQSNNTPTPQPEPPKPVEVLGIPVCIPLTHMCINQ